MMDERRGKKFFFFLAKDLDSGKNARVGAAELHGQNLPCVGHVLLKSQADIGALCKDACPLLVAGWLDQLALQHPPLVRMIPRCRKLCVQVLVLPKVKKGQHLAGKVMEKKEKGKKA
jgi:hypothetical protein